MQLLQAKVCKEGCRRTCSSYLLMLGIVRGIFTVLQRKILEITMHLRKILGRDMNITGSCEGETV